MKSEVKSLLKQRKKTNKGLKTYKNNVGYQTGITESLTRIQERPVESIFTNEESK